MDRTGQISSAPCHNLPCHLQKVRVQPREDEGNEVLPPYSTAISLAGFLERKMELSNVAQRAKDRNWNLVYVTLQGTALNIYKNPRCKPLRRKLVGPNLSTHLIRSYNLQHAQVGIAADYTKKKQVIRVRAETEQFLLYCVKIEILVCWMQSLSIAIDLAVPLDDRNYPAESWLPRRQRRIQNHEQSPNGRSNIRRAPRRTYISISASRSISQRSNSRIISDARPAPHPRVVSNVRECGGGGEREHKSLRNSIRKSFLNLRSSSLSPLPPVPPLPELNLIPSSTESSIHSDSSSISTQVEKWRPFHYWSPIFDLVYAKRCMAILTTCTPHKSNLVIINGEFWVVDWVTGNMNKLRNISTESDVTENVSSETKSQEDDFMEQPPGYRELEVDKL